MRDRTQRLVASWSHTKHQSCNYFRARHRFRCLCRREQVAIISQQTQPPSCVTASARRPWGSVLWVSGACWGGGMTTFFSASLTKPLGAAVRSCGSVVSTSHSGVSPSSESASLEGWLISGDSFLSLLSSSSFLHVGAILVTCPCVGQKRKVRVVPRSWRQLTLR